MTLKSADVIFMGDFVEKLLVFPDSWDNFQQ
jgi:hypothetical protein